MTLISVAASVTTPLVVAAISATLRILPILVLILITCKQKFIKPSFFVLTELTLTVLCIIVLSLLRS